MSEEKQTISYDEFSRLDLRVAEIINVEEIENADKLYKLEIKLGDENRILVAGIKQHYEKEALIGKKIIIIANLEPRKMKGVESQGMLLAASDDENIVLLTIDKDIESGTKIS